MKTIMITFDSLNRRMLPCYGKTDIIAPEFEDLAMRCVRFDSAYAGSLPCMPARREMHTGRENFLHSRWSCLEPFDDSMPELLREAGIHSHLTTDHVHYWEDAGFGYHTRYNTFQFSRGQEGDPLWGVVDTKSLQERMAGRRVPHLRVQDAVNRRALKNAQTYPQWETFDNGIRFIHENNGSDNWFLHIETFDPHEPFCAPQEFRDLYGLSEPSSQEEDWPDYMYIDIAGMEERIARYRQEYMALVSYCSHNLGRVLKEMDRYNLWKDTMLIVNTDHGFLLGEHGWLGKNTGPYYNEIANIPLFIYDPRSPSPGSSDALVQTVDLAATILDFHNLSLPADMTGRPIRFGSCEPERTFAIWGLFGGQICCTDGRYTLMKAPVADAEISCYTMSGLHFARERIMKGGDPYTLELTDPFSFSKGHPLLKVSGMGNDFQSRQPSFGDILFDLCNDPGQDHPIQDELVKNRLEALLARKLRELETPYDTMRAYGLDSK